MRNICHIFIVLSLFSLQSATMATSFTPISKTPQFPDYTPFKGEGIFVLESEESDILVLRCSLQPTETLTYWVLSEQLVRLVDKKLNLYLKEKKYLLADKKRHKQFFGMKREDGHKFIYVFVYPKPSAAIDKEQGNSLLLCGNISNSYLKIEFDYKSLTFKTL
jgi:hypothetical protein